MKLETIAEETDQERQRLRKRERRSIEKQRLRKGENNRETMIEKETDQGIDNDCKIKKSRIKRSRTRHN